MARRATPRRISGKFAKCCDFEFARLLPSPRRAASPLSLPAAARGAARCAAGEQCEATMAQRRNGATA